MLSSDAALPAEGCELICVKDETPLYHWDPRNCEIQQSLGRAQVCDRFSDQFFFLRKRGPSNNCTTTKKIPYMRSAWPLRPILFRVPCRFPLKWYGPHGDDAEVNGGMSGLGSRLRLTGSGQALKRSIGAQADPRPISESAFFWSP